MKKKTIKLLNKALTVCTFLMIALWIAAFANYKEHIVVCFIFALSSFIPVCVQNLIARIIDDYMYEAEIKKEVGY